MAAPHVAGLAALIKSLKPWLDVDEIMDVIRYSADDVNSSQHKGKDNYIGYGRINMEKALVPVKIGE
jgi:subtilisin family serine protease